MKVADEVWIATALFHWEHAGRETFSMREIVDPAAIPAQYQQLLHR